MGAINIGAEDPALQELTFGLLNQRNQSIAAADAAEAARLQGIEDAQSQFMFELENGPGSTVKTAEGIFVLYPDGTLGPRLGSPVVSGGDTYSFGNTPAEVLANDRFGDPGQGLVWKLGSDGEVVIGANGAPIAIAYEGGPVWQDQQDAAVAAAAAEGHAAGAANTQNVQYMVLKDDVGRALDLAQNEAAVGQLGALTADVSGSPAYNLRQTLLGIEATIAFDSLQAMRDASQTGGALGAVSEKEIALLAATYGSIDAGQSGSILKYNLQRLDWAMDKVVNGMPDGQGGLRPVTQDDFDAFTATLGGPDAPPVAAPDMTDEEIKRSLGIE